MAFRGAAPLAAQIVSRPSIKWMGFSWIFCTPGTYIDIGGAHKTRPYIQLCVNHLSMQHYLGFLCIRVGLITTVDSKDRMVFLILIVHLPYISNLYLISTKYPYENVGMESNEYGNVYDIILNYSQTHSIDLASVVPIEDIIYMNLECVSTQAISTACFHQGECYD